MSHDDVPPPAPADRLGRMLLLSMVCHLVLFGSLGWYASRTPKVKPLVPTYTVDLVNLPLPPPGAKTVAPPESPAPAPAVQPEALPRRQPLPPPQTEAGRVRPAVPKPAAPVKPAIPPRLKTAPTQPKKPEPPQTTPKPAPVAPKPAARPVPAPAPSPVAPPQAVKPPAPASPVTKTSPATPAPAAEVSRARARDRQIAQEINAARQKAAASERQRQIQESVQGLEKALAARSRDRAYQEAVGQAAARLQAGKVSTKVAQGGSGGAGSGSQGQAQTAAYGAQVSQVVRRHWQPHCLPRSNLQKLKAVIIVRIQPDGAISAAWFEQESGDRLFDQSAMTAVTRSSPLPALPPGQPHLELGITFTPEWKANAS